jgi:PEP-CTERM motif
MRFGSLIAVAAALLGIASAPARAGLAGAFVDTVSYFDVSDPPPGPTSVSGSTPAPTPDCTTIHFCNILNYPLPTPPNPPGSSQNFPFPTVPLTGTLDYLLDSLSQTLVSVGDTKITITNNIAGLFCFTASCTGPFSGFGFFFSSGVDITNVTVDSKSSTDFLPVLPGGLSSTATSVTVNLNGDNPAVGSSLILDVSFTPVGPPVPEPSTWALMLLGFAGLGFAGWRRMATQTT